MAESFVRVAATGDIPPGTARTVEVGDHQIALCNVGGTYYAIDDACTHRGGSLGAGTLEGSALQCPLHRSRFDVTTGEAVGRPATEPVNAYQVRVQGSDIEVATE
ncbi:MAG: non-heme iron oxygenase ferredoxin subunit [Chloroflexi bacterium]|nr:non-heme iron oxygenase ferredoxin subunit [Chloroflexota bacterium]